MSSARNYFHRTTAGDTTCKDLLYCRRCNSPSKRADHHAGPILSSDRHLGMQFVVHCVKEDHDGTLHRPSCHYLDGHRQCASMAIRSRTAASHDVPLSPIISSRIRARKVAPYNHVRFMSRSDDATAAADRRVPCCAGIHGEHGQPRH
jgi:hypothetical protein